MNQFVIVNDFKSMDGDGIRQFFGGISTGSGYPLWMLRVERAAKYDTVLQACAALDRIHDRCAGHSYSVIEVSEGEELEDTACLDRPIDPVEEQPEGFPASAGFAPRSTREQSFWAGNKERFPVLVGEDVTLCTFPDELSALSYALGLHGLLTDEAYRSITDRKSVV